MVDKSSARPEPPIAAPVGPPPEPPPGVSPEVRLEGYKKAVDWYRDMALRFSEDRDIQKHRARDAEAALAKLHTIVREALAHYGRNGGCSNCGGIPHTLTCMVGRLAAAIESNK